MNITHLLILLGGIVIGGSVPLVVIRWTLQLGRKKANR